MQPHQPNFQFKVRLGTNHDLEAVAALFAAHYASDLTSRDAESAQRLSKELAGVESGSTVLAVAEARGEIIGAALAVLDRDFFITSVRFFLSPQAIVLDVINYL